MRPALPSGQFALVDAEFNATVPFNEWESFIDGQIVSLAIGVGRRYPLPPGAIVVGGRATVPYGQWLRYVNQSLSTFGSPTKRAPLPPSNVQLMGADRKATVPFLMWLTYIDKLLG